MVAVSQSVALLRIPWVAGLGWERRGDTGGRVVLEMIDGDKREVETRMSMLQELAG